MVNFVFFIFWYSEFLNFIILIRHWRIVILSQNNIWIFLFFYRYLLVYCRIDSLHQRWNLHFDSHGYLFGSNSLSNYWSMWNIHYRLHLWSVVLTQYRRIRIFTVVIYCKHIFWHRIWQVLWQLEEYDWLEPKNFDKISNCRDDQPSSANRHFADSLQWSSGFNIW